jgi:hypothetical protein
MDKFERKSKFRSQLRVEIKKFITRDLSVKGMRIQGPNSIEIRNIIERK